MSDFTPAHMPFTGRRMLLVMVAFFGTIIAVNGTMLTVAVNTFGGLVVQNSYVASQNFNRDIAAAKAQPIRGWTAGVAADTDGLAVTLTDATGPVPGLAIEATLNRPTHAREGHRFTLIEREPGIDAAILPIEAGQWTLTLATDGGQVRSLPVTVRAR